MNTGWNGMALARVKLNNVLLATVVTKPGTERRKGY
jgi:hypothetical protein